MVHLDLFSGIGGFAYALDQLQGGVQHIFCDNDPFCQQVLKKHWPEAEIYEDIKQLAWLLAYAGSGKQRGLSSRLQGHQVPPAWRGSVDIVTGGFPCQPFSEAGPRSGTADDRHLWPEMLKVIQLTKPSWVIAENVRGILTIENGLVFEHVCLDLEAEGYSVQPFIIPAAAVNAPHRRDRIWIIAHRPGTRLQRQNRRRSPGLSGIGERDAGWNRDWLEVAAELCRVDDGLPVQLDEFKLTKPQHRAAQLKAYGNAIVPQVALELMRGILL